MNSLKQVNCPNMKSAIVSHCSKCWNQLLGLFNFDFFSLLFFGWSTGIFLHEWVYAFQKKFSLDVFDSSLRLISGMYMYFGYKPYTDFGSVYPPGMLILQSIFRTTYNSRYEVFALLFLIYSVLLVLLYIRQTRSLLTTGVLVLALGLSFTLRTDPFIEVFWIAFIVFTYLYLKTKSSYYYGLAVFSASAASLFKWERTVTLLIILLFCLPIFKYLYQKFSLTKIVHLVSLSLLLGLAISVIFLLISGSNLFDALYFIIVVPLKILPYRQLPLTAYNISSDSLFDKAHSLYVGVIFFTIFIFNQLPRLLKRDRDGVLLFLIVSPLSLIPYASGRSDFVHIFPFLLTLLLSLGLFADHSRKLPLALFLYMTYLICTLNLLTFTFSQLVRPTPTYLDNLDSSLADCKRLSLDKGYRTIFVGRTSYGHYIYNHAMLYLINPAVKPATRYISDEPGLQNTCFDGERIAQDLTAAMKPVLAYLETEPQVTEPNMSSNMVSCGHIENWLIKNSYDNLGTCMHEGVKFAVRVYK